MVLTLFSDSAKDVIEHFLSSELRSLQRGDGCFYSSADGGDCDVRFLYCACVISAIINDWSGVNKDLAVEYIRGCITYEGGLSLFPGMAFVFNNMQLITYYMIVYNRKYILPIHFIL